MINVNEQDLQVAEYLKTIGIKYSVIAAGQDVEEYGWKHDAWIAVLNNERFDYRMGTGHRFVPQFLTPKEKKELAKLREITGWTVHFPQTRELKRNPSKNGYPREAYACALPPTSASVLYSLTLDVEAGETTFAAWCDNFGYDTDSRKALAIYEACQQNADKLRKLFTSDQIAHLSNLLQDY